MSRIHRTALVPYSAHEMFLLVSDIASYPQFLPWCGGARILSASEDEVVASIDISYGSVHKTFTTRNLLQRDKLMELRLMEGPFSHLHGYWRFEPIDETGCRLSLDLEFEVSNRLLGAMLGKVFGTIAGEMVDGFHRRAIQLYGQRD